MCLTVRRQLQCGHSGALSRLNRNPCVRWVCPSLHRVRTLSSFLTSCDGFMFFNMGSILCSLLFVSRSHMFWNFVSINLIIADFRSVKGILPPVTSGYWRAAFASWSARSFPPIPTWLGTHINITSVWILCRLFNLSSISRMQGFSHLAFWIACRQERESQIKTNFLPSDCEIYSRAAFMAFSSAVYTDEWALHDQRLRRWPQQPHTRHDQYPSIHQ